jgi:hypothetical protein
VRIDSYDHFSHDILHLDQGMTAASMSDFQIDLVRASNE